MQPLLACELVPGLSKSLILVVWSDWSRKYSPQMHNFSGTVFTMRPPDKTLGVYTRHHCVLLCRSLPTFDTYSLVLAAEFTIGNQIIVLHAAIKIKFPHALWCFWFIGPDAWEGGYFHLQVCAAPNGMVFEPFWSGIEYRF